MRARPRRRPRRKPDDLRVFESIATFSRSPPAARPGDAPVCRGVPYQGLAHELRRSDVSVLPDDGCPGGRLAGDRTGGGICGGPSGALPAGRRWEACACARHRRAGLERDGGRHRARRHAREIPSRERPLHGLRAGRRVRRRGEHRRALRAVPCVRDAGIAAGCVHSGGSRGRGIHGPGLLLPAAGGDAADDLHGVPRRPSERRPVCRRRDRTGGRQRHHHHAYGRRPGRRDLDALRSRSDHARRVGLRAAAVPPVGADAVARVHATVHAAGAVAVPCRASAQSQEPSLRA